jgi:hypothetical protein
MMIPFKEFDGLQATSVLSAMLHYKRITHGFLQNSYLVTIFLGWPRPLALMLFLQFH